MGLNDSNAENKQSVNDCSEMKEILTGLLTIFNARLSWCWYHGERKYVYPHGRTAYSTQTPLNSIIMFSTKYQRAQFYVLTLEGFSWLMMVVLPLLSRPKHKTLTSFFLRPSQPDSLSSSPIRLD